MIQEDKAEEEKPESTPVIRPPPRTEIFESFDVAKEEDLLPSKKPSVPGHPLGPSPNFDFLDELKLKLRAKAQQIESSDAAVYKEFDKQQNKFVEIPKDLRD